MSRVYSYKGTIVKVIGAEPDRVLLQECKSSAIAWADWSDFHELAELCDDDEIKWRAEEVTIEDNSAWCVCRTLLGTGDRERRSNLEVFDGGRLYPYRAEAEEIANWLNERSKHD